MNIFIPAAGFGTRLLPLTAHIPKPLLPVLGKPLLELLLARLQNSDLECIGINTHYQADKMLQWSKQSAFREQIQLFPENPILGSGGALSNARALLSQDDFIVYNSDVVCDLDLNWLLEQHRQSQNCVTLTVCTQPKWPHVLMNVAVDAAGQFQGVDDNLIPEAQITKRVAYTSIAVYSPEFLQFLPKGHGSVLKAWLVAATKGYRIGTVDISEYYWDDIGTPEAYFAQVMTHLRATNQTTFIHPNTRIADTASLGKQVIVEAGCTLGQGVSLENCLVMPGTKLTGNHYQNCIIGPDYCKLLEISNASSI